MHYETSTIVSIPHFVHFVEKKIEIECLKLLDQMTDYVGRPSAAAIIQAEIQFQKIRHPS